MLTVYMENLKNRVGKSNGDPLSLLLFRFHVDSDTFGKLPILCLDNLNHFIFIPKISNRVFCLNGKPPCYDQTNAKKS